MRERGTVRFALRGEVYLHALLTRLTGIQGFGTRLSTRRVLRLIKKCRPDVIHFHNIHGYYLDLSVARAVGRLRIPVVWTFYNAWPIAGKCGHFVDCDRWKPGCGQCPYVREYPRAFLDSSAWMWPRKPELLGKVWKPVIVSPSQWLASLVREALEENCPVRVIPHGIDTDVFRPLGRDGSRREVGLDVGKRVVLFGANKLSSRIKDTTQFLESLRYVGAPDLIAVIAGSEGEGIDRTKVPVEVQLLGPVRGSERMAKLYNAADIYCITSLADNFPTTVLEAMACGTPVVGFAVGGIGEQVTTECGTLVEAGDVQALGKAIAELLDGEAARDRIAACCRQRARQKCSLQQFVQAHLTLYEELAAAVKEGRRL